MDEYASEFFDFFRGDESQTIESVINGEFDSEGKKR